MKNKKREKTNSERRAGFTIAESLVAIIILLLVSAVVAAGIPAAARAYENVVITSNSEVLLSTAMSALRNELSTSRDIEIMDGGSSVQYYNIAFGSMSKLSKDPDNGNILYARYYADEELIGAYVPEGEGGAVSLVSDEASGKDLLVTYDGVSFKENDNVICFSNLKVIKKSTGETTVATVPVYSIRVVAK